MFSAGDFLCSDKAVDDGYHPAGERRACQKQDEDRDGDDYAEQRAYAGAFGGFGLAADVAGLFGEK